MARKTGNADGAVKSDAGRCGRIDLNPQEVTTAIQQPRKESISFSMSPLDPSSIGASPLTEVHLGEIEAELVDRLLAELGIEGYRCEDLGGPLLYQDVWTDRVILQRVARQRMVIHVKCDTIVTAAGIAGPLGDPEDSSTYVALCRCFESLYKLWRVHSGSSLTAHDVWCAYELGMMLNQLRMQRVYDHLNILPNAESLERARHRYETASRIYQRAAEEARDAGHAPYDSGCAEVARHTDIQPQTVAKVLSQGRQKYGPVATLVADKLHPLASD